MKPNPARPVSISGSAAGEILAMPAHHRGADQAIDDRERRGGKLGQQQIGQERADFGGLDRAARRRRDVVAFRFPIDVQRVDARGFYIVESGGVEMWRPFERVHTGLGNLKTSVKPYLTLAVFHADCDETVFPKFDR
jgi:hypothetical protein